MSIYFISILIVFTLALLAQNTKDIKAPNNKIYIKSNVFFVSLITLYLIIISGLRWEVGTDYGTYANNYRGYAENVLDSVFTYSEPGINVIAWISSILYDDYITMFFIASAITIVLFVSTISKYSKMFVFSMLLFILLGVWHGTFNGVRQYLACAVIFAGHRYILNKNFLKYLLVIFIASLFHISSLVMLLLYFVPKKKLKFKNIIYLSILTFILVYGASFIFEMIDDFKDSSISSSSYAQREVNVLRVLVAFAPLLLYFTITERSKLKNDDFFYINLLIINALTMVVTSQSAYLARFFIYTNVFTVLGIPRLLNINDKYLKFLVQMVIIIFYAVFWYIEVSQTDNLVNFRWIFERSI